MHQRYGEVASRFAVNVAEDDSEPEGVEKLAEILMEETENAAEISIAVSSPYL